MATSNPVLEAIAAEVRENGMDLQYWAVSDASWSTFDHIFEISSGYLPRCGHSHHAVGLEGTIISLGTCSTFDLSEPDSVQEILDFFAPCENKLSVRYRTGPISRLNHK